MFSELPSDVSFPQLETDVLRFWKERRIYEKSLEQRAGKPKFVFYEGPPTANGLPHPGHCLTRAVKDLFPRYRTMRGNLCLRKAGWDTHGLPVEVEVCKELGIHSKHEIEQYGVEPFIRKCQQSVWRYVQQWEQLTERIGFWVDLDQAYVTYHQTYVESVWWCLARLFERGLLYEGHKIVWWWAQGGTALSSGEVGQGYRQVADPSVFVRFPLVDSPAGSPPGQNPPSLVVWTTTPWTLPNNQFAAVHPQVRYATAVDGETGERLILAESLVESLASKLKRPLTVESTCEGRDLIGLRYRPPFDYYYADAGEQQGRLRSGGRQHIAWRVVAADFVTVDSGTGVVHQAPAFGEVDFDVLLEQQQQFVDGEGPPLLCAVGPDGRFTDQAPDFQGRWVKDADKDIVRDLRARGLLLHQEQYLHEYPFCWRAEEDPLIQYPRRSWFIRTTQFKAQMLANNQRIGWLPEHIRDGRFGNFLQSNVDWALSRERFWGTPLPIWRCEQTGRMEAIASYEELMAKPGVQGTDVWEHAKRKHPEMPEDLRVHKPYIDAVHYESPFAPGARMRRVPDVIDCWFDSGAMPFAQWGYPHRGRDEFASQFPADFISEAIDQTRGWFYSLLAISTLMFGPEGAAGESSEAAPFPHPYRNCVVLGLMLGEDGEKMSKSKRNYREPQEIFDRYGADALRWYFFANQPPWTTIRYSEQAIRDSIPEFLLRLWNVLSFFTIYANIDGFDPSAELSGSVGQLDTATLARGTGYRPVQQRSELDRWILSELHRSAAEVVERMDQYDNYNACQRLHGFVDALSNWYVRRSRARFWGPDPHDPDKRDAYWTLYECLLTTARMIAPFVPFLAEYLWQHLTSGFNGRAAESVHLCDYPQGDPRRVDSELSQRMDAAREIASLGRSARMQARLKVRQPLREVLVVLADDRHLAWLEDHGEVIREELNVKEVRFTQHAEEYIQYEVLPNFKQLGPRLGPLMPRVKQQLLSADGGRLRRELQEQGLLHLTVDGQAVQLTADEVQIRLQAREGWAAAPGRHSVVILSTDLDQALVREGLARDLVRLIQDRRKAIQCQYTDRIRVGVVTDSSQLQMAVQENRAYLMEETLAVELADRALPATEPVQHDLSGHAVTLYVENVTSR